MDRLSPIDAKNEAESYEMTQDDVQKIINKLKTFMLFYLNICKIIFLKL